MVKNGWDSYPTKCISHPIDHVATIWLSGLPKNIWLSEISIRVSLVHTNFIAIPGDSMHFKAHLVSKIVNYRNLSYGLCCMKGKFPSNKSHVVQPKFILNFFVLSVPPEFNMACDLNPMYFVLTLLASCKSKRTHILVLNIWVIGHED
jgi:hypothetical protein